MDNKYQQLISVSNPEIVKNNLQKYFGKTTDLYISNHKNKKYMIYNPNKDKMVHFGDIRYKDYTYTTNPIKRSSYLKRSTNIRGSWKDDKYSPNNLSIWTLWNIL